MNKLISGLIGVIILLALLTLLVMIILFPLKALGADCVMGFKITGTEAQMCLKCDGDKETRTMLSCTSEYFEVKGLPYLLYECCEFGKFIPGMPEENKCYSVIIPTHPKI